MYLTINLVQEKFRIFFIRIDEKRATIRRFPELWRDIKKVSTLRETICNTTLINFAGRSF